MSASHDDDPVVRVDPDERILALVHDVLSDGGDESDDPLTVLSGLVRRVAEAVEGAESASVSLVRTGSMRTLVASDDLAEQVDALQYRLGSGPCVDAALEDHVYVTGEIGDDPRWPAFGEAAIRETGVRSILGHRLRLLDEESAIAALNVYATAPAAFDDRAVRRTTLFATQCALLVTAHLAQQRAAHLERALASNREIGVAVGVLMRAHLVTHDEAFAMLRMASQDTNRKLADVAADVAAHGDLPLRRLAREG